MVRHKHSETFLERRAIMTLKAAALASSLQKEVVGQEEAIGAVVRTVIVASMGISDPQRPLGTFLFAGPTGVGKSQLGRSLAKILHGNERSAVVINCTEFKNPHDAAKLIGAPPGYVGHEQPPFLTPEKLEKRFTVVIFEELEKADPNLCDVLLQVLERGELKTGRGVDLNFSNCFIFMTSNVGAREADQMRRGGIGFGAAPSLLVILPEDAQARKEEEEERRIYRRKIEGAFKPEFINRLDDVIIFRRLGQAHLLAILNKFLLDTKARCATAGWSTVIAEAAKMFLLEKGSDFRYGARPMRRAIHRHLEFPLANFVDEQGGTAQANGDLVVYVLYHPGDHGLSFRSERLMKGAMTA